MTSSDPKSPPGPRPSLVLRKIPDYAPLPVVRPPPRRSRAGSLPPVAASVPPPAAQPGVAFIRWPLAPRSPLLFAGGIGIAGALVAATAALVVRAPAPSPSQAPTAATVVVHAERPVPPPIDSTPWVEVPIQVPLPATTSAPAAAPPQPAPAPAHPVRHPARPGSSPAVLAPAAAAENNAKAARVAPHSPPARTAPPLDPVLKAVQQEMRAGTKPSDATGEESSAPP